LRRLHFPTTPATAPPGPLVHRRISVGRPGDAHGLTGASVRVALNGQPDLLVDRSQPSKVTRRHRAQEIIGLHNDVALRRSARSAGKPGLTSLIRVPSKWRRRAALDRPAPRRYDRARHGPSLWAGLSLFSPRWWDGKVGPRSVRSDILRVADTVTDLRP
jgi:hypothetical protein